VGPADAALSAVRLGLEPVSNRQRTFAPSGFFALRTPLLPHCDLTAWWSDLEAPRTPSESEELESAVARDRAVLGLRLRAAYRRPELRDALFLASPVLEQSLDGWLVGEPGRQADSLEPSLTRYFVRACARPTPFGLFAGCSTGTIGPRTRLELPGRAAYRRHSRLDGAYLDALTAALAREPALADTLVFRPNTSLYRVGGRVRYVQARIDRDAHGGERRRTHHLVAVDDSKAVTRALAVAESGATASDLALELTGDRITEAAARGFVAALIERQIVVPELGLRATGVEPLDDVVTQLRDAGAIDAAGVLDRVRTELESVDRAGLATETGRYRALAAQLEELPTKAALPQLFQVDMTKPAPAAVLGEAVVAELSRGVELLCGLVRPPSNDELTRFRDAFTARYERIAVPLVEALDEESGIGATLAASGRAAASPLLAGLPFALAGEDTRPWGRRERVLLNLLARALARGDREIVLDRTDLDAMVEPRHPPVPDAFAVMATIAAASQEALDRGDFRVLFQGAEGPSGARLLGRFLYADPELRQGVENHLRAEEALRPDAVFAEIVHIPRGRLGNIVYRPVLRAYELPYLGRSGAPAASQLPVTDLLVSVDDGEIVLRSQRLGKTVVPRLTTAHNFRAGSLTLYRFLCLLQNQRSAPAVFFDWGVLADAPFLPRVRNGRLVLSRASWRLRREELRRLGAAHGADLFRVVRTLRAERDIPRHVGLVDRDRVLPVDFECVLSLESFVQLVKQRETALLAEPFAEPDALCARGPEGAFVHEIVVPFVRTAPAKNGAEPASGGEPSAVPATFRRSLLPGSEWLYAKLYAGAAGLDRLLLDVVAPLVHELTLAGAVDEWFFLRYGDPDLHLRVRFHGEPEVLHAHVLPALEAAAERPLADGRLRRLQLDTYEREVERYGGAEGLLVAERIFRIDSDAVLAILALLDLDDAGADERWRLALLGCAAMLADFGIDRARRLALADSLRDALQREQQWKSELATGLGKRFRRERASLESLLESLESPSDASNPLGPGIALIRERSARLAPLAAELRSLEQAQRLTLPRDALVLSYVHMHVNRAVRAGTRAHELVLYDFLARLYRTQEARAPSRDA
jgi:thiopeptide-type bacteriocin biosynthesis protein